MNKITETEFFLLVLILRIIYKSPSSRVGHRYSSTLFIKKVQKWIASVAASRTLLTLYSGWSTKPISFQQAALCCRYANLSLIKPRWQRSATSDSFDCITRLFNWQPLFVESLKGRHVLVFLLVDFYKRFCFISFNTCLAYWVALSCTSFQNIYLCLVFLKMVSLSIFILSVCKGNGSFGELVAWPRSKNLLMLIKNYGNSTDRVKFMDRGFTHTVESNLKQILLQVSYL